MAGRSPGKTSPAGLDHGRPGRPPAGPPAAYRSAMRVAVLGPLEVLTDAGAQVAVRGAEERLLLAVLAAGAPEVVPTDELVRALGADTSLTDHLARLRHALEPAQPLTASGQYVLHRGPGYVLAVGRADIDAVHLADLVDRGRRQLAAGDEAQAARSLGAALALWRGEPYDEWPDAEFAVAGRHRLAELRSAAEAALHEARQRLAEQPAPRPVALARGAPADYAPPAYVGTPLGGPVAPRPALPPVEPPDWGFTPVAGGGGRRRRRLLGAGVVAVLVAALVSARLAIRSAEDSALDATADRLAVLSATEAPLDTPVLLAAEGFRLADTAPTRAALPTVGDDHQRAARVVSFIGNPQDPVLSGGGRAVTFGTGVSVLEWTVGTSDTPHVLLGIPPEWGAWIAAAPSPVDEEVMGAGVAGSGPWLRMVSASDGTNRLLLQGDQLGGRPVDGAVSADGTRVLLLVAAPAPEAPDDASRWTLLDVDARDGTSRPTGISGTTAVSVEGLRADFADDAGSFVVWDDFGTATALLVEVADGRQTPIAAVRDPTRSTGFRAFPGGAAQLWDDGLVTLVDRAGTPIQQLGVHAVPVQDVVVAPDGSWAVTVDAVGRVVRWDVDPATGRWSGSVALDGHTAAVVGAEVDATGGTLVTVSRDHSILSWRMAADDGPGADQRSTDPAALLRAACALVGRDLDPGEWRRYLPGRHWQPTCTDLG